MITLVIELNNGNGFHHTHRETIGLTKGMTKLIEAQDLPQFQRGIAYWRGQKLYDTEEE